MFGIQKFYESLFEWLFIKKHQVQIEAYREDWACPSGLPLIIKLLLLYRNNGATCFWKNYCNEFKKTQYISMSTCLLTCGIINHSGDNQAVVEWVML